MATEALMKHGVMLVTLAVIQIKASGVVLDLLRVESEIEHRYAVTHVTASFVNLRNASQEVPLRMTLPKDAYVSSLVIEVGERNYTTIVTEKKRNRRRKGAAPQHRGEDNNPRKSRVADLQKFRAGARVKGLQRVTFYLSYEELLLRRRGAYTHDLHLGIAKRIESVEVSVSVIETEEIKNYTLVRLPWKSFRASGEETMEEREERLGPGEITFSLRRENVSLSNINHTIDDAGDDADDAGGLLSISFDVARKADGGEVQILGQFFVHRFSPDGLPKLPTHTVFVLDVSGSMHDNGKLIQLKMAMRSILTNLPPEDSFEILVFSTRVTSLGVYHSTPKDIEKSLQRVERLQPIGGTNFNEAFLRALHDINNFNLSSGAKQIVFLTDGQPNLGEKEPSQLRRNIREANIHQLPIFSLGFGQDADMKLLRQVSSDNKGFTRQINEDVRPADQMKGFYDEISSPLMTDVDVMYADDEVDLSSLVRHGPSIFYQGDEMVLAGQLRDGVTEVQPIVTGKGNDGPLQFQVSRISSQETPQERNNYVERLWAYLTVKDLLDTQEVVEDRNLKAEMNFRALEIALKFQFVTKITSLEPEGEGNGDPRDPSRKVKGHKSASRHQKSNTGSVNLFFDHLALLSEAEFAKTLPAPLSTKLNTASNSRPFFSDNDPHFVVQVSGIEIPLCFDIHGHHGEILNLIRDENSGIIVNGLVTSAIGSPKMTYFTKLFIVLGEANFTITPHNISISSPRGHRNSKIQRVLRSVWPFKKMYRRGRTDLGKKSRKRSRKRPSRGRDRHSTTENPPPTTTKGTAHSSMIKNKYKMPAKRNKKMRFKRNIFLRKIKEIVHPQAHREHRQLQTGREIKQTADLRTHKHQSRDHQSPEHRRVRHRKSNIRMSLRSPLAAAVQYNRTLIRFDESSRFANHEYATTTGDSINTTVIPQPLTQRVSGQEESLLSSSISVIGTSQDLADTGEEERHLIHPQANWFQQISRNGSSMHPQKAHYLPDSTQSMMKNAPEDTVTFSTAINVTQLAIINREYLHPHSKLFAHTTGSVTDMESTTEGVGQANVTLESTRYLTSETNGTHEDPSQLHHHLDFTSQEVAEDSTRERKTKKRKQKSYTWKRAAGRRYGEVVVSLRNRKKLELLLGDVDAHFVITRSKTKYGQEYLGFYVEERNILSPNATGIIGQFAYKTVSTLSPRSTASGSQSGMTLAVLHQQPNLRYRVSEVNGMMSKRRSMLNKNHVRCLLIPNQGQGLVAGSPEDYVVPCLTC